MKRAKGYRNTVAAGRIRAVSPEMVRPFVARMPEPQLGESLLGFITRCLSLTPAKRTIQGLALAGIGKLQPFSLATTLEPGAPVDGIARLFQTDPAQILTKLHRIGTLDNGKSEAIDFFGVMIRADYREKTIRRVSPRALETSLHHRALWDIRLFSFDPETNETLLDTCPVCKHKLGWMRSFGVHMCDRCVDKEGLASVDLRDFPQPLVAVGDTEALDFVTGLVDPNSDRKEMALRKARSPWAGFAPSELFETVIAFACVLTMAPDKARTTLERPKDVSDYRRFTPEILAAAGRAIMDGKPGFAAIADRIRAQADQRPGYYGVKKELGPLFCMSVDQHLSKPVKQIIKSAITEDMKRTKNDVALRRGDYASDERNSPIESLALETGLPRKNLGWLADSGYVEVIRSEHSVQSPKLLPIAAVLPLVIPFHDAMHEKYAAGMLAVKPHVLPDLVARQLLVELKGAVLGLFKTRAAYFSRSSVEALARSITEKARSSGAPPSRGMQISKAVKRLALTPVPWGAVIAAIVKGTVRIHTHPGENRNWLTGVAVCDVPAFVRAVRAEAGGTRPIVLDDWIPISPAAEIMGVNEVLASCILPNQCEIPKDDRIRRQHPGVARYSRTDIERFARTYIFGAEIQRRIGISRGCDVRPWLEKRGVDTAFRLEENRKFGYRRDEVEPVLAREKEALKTAAE